METGYAVAGEAGRMVDTRGVRSAERTGVKALFPSKTPSSISRTSTTTMSTGMVRSMSSGIPEGGTVIVRRRTRTGRHRGQRGALAVLRHTLTEPRISQLDCTVAPVGLKGTPN